jgi:hypothetical protein
MLNMRPSIMNLHLKSQNEDIKPLKNITSDFKKTALESLNLNLQNNIRIDPIKELLYKVTKNREDETLKESAFLLRTKN